MSRPHISNHALLRFLERVGGLDIEGVRAAIAQSLTQAHETAERVGGGRYLILLDGFVYLVQGGTVVTVIEQGDDEKLRARLLGRKAN